MHKTPICASGSSDLISLSIPPSEKTAMTLPDKKTFPALPGKKTFPAFTRTEIEVLAFLVWIHVLLGTVARLEPVSGATSRGPSRRRPHRS